MLITVKVVIYARGKVHVFDCQTLCVGVKYTVACSTTYNLRGHCFSHLDRVIPL